MSGAISGISAFSGNQPLPHLAHAGYIRCDNSKMSILTVRHRFASAVKRGHRSLCGDFLATFLREFSRAGYSTSAREFCNVHDDTISRPCKEAGDRNGQNSQAKHISGAGCAPQRNVARATACRVLRAFRLYRLFCGWCHCLPKWGVLYSVFGSDVFSLPFWRPL